MQHAQNSCFLTVSDCHHPWYTYAEAITTLVSGTSGIVTSSCSVISACIIRTLQVLPF